MEADPLTTDPNSIYYGCVAFNLEALKWSAISPEFGQMFLHGGVTLSIGAQKYFVLGVGSHVETTLDGNLAPDSRARVHGYLRPAEYGM